MALFNDWITVYLYVLLSSATKIIIMHGDHSIIGKENGFMEME